MAVWLPTHDQGEYPSPPEIPEQPTAGNWHLEEAVGWESLQRTVIPSQAFVRRRWKRWTSNTMTCPGTVTVIVIAAYEAHSTYGSGSSEPLATVSRVHEAVEDAVGNPVNDARPGPDNGPHLLDEVAKLVTCPGECVRSEELVSTEWSVPFGYPNPEQDHKKGHDYTETVYFVGVKRISCAKKPTDGGGGMIVPPPPGGGGGGEQTPPKSTEGGSGTG